MYIQYIKVQKFCFPQSCLEFGRNNFRHMITNNSIKRRATKVPCKLQYSLKFSRLKIFADFAGRSMAMKIFSHEISSSQLMQCMARTLTTKILSAKNLFKSRIWQNRKIFNPQKFQAIRYLCVPNTEDPLLIQLMQSSTHLHATCRPPPCL